MCYHTSTPSRKALQEAVGKDVLIEEYKPYYHVNGYAHPEMPLMLSEDSKRVQAVSWGFIPPGSSESFAADFQKKGYSLNAKAETIFSLPIYRDSAKAHRCLVFVNGFFEWKHESISGKEVKTPYFIKLPEEKVFALGGLYSYRKTDEEMLKTHNILTTPANELMASIHNTKKRMPLILEEKDWALWLDSRAPESAVKEIMKQFPEGLLDAYPVQLSLKKGVDTNVRDVQERV